MKKLSLFLVLAIALMVLAACGSEESTEASNSAEAASDKIGENNENLVKQFNESQDKIHVTAEFQCCKSSRSS